jgi:hypothetical protein
MLWWDLYGFNKKHIGTRYADLVFFNPVEFAGHVVHSSASGERNGDAQFFMVGWGPVRIRQKNIGTHYAELVVFASVGSVGCVVHSGASGA